MSRCSARVSESVRCASISLSLEARARSLGGDQGVRAGVDASGKPYVAGGRGGIYFRERVPTADTTPTEAGRPRSGSVTLAWTVAIVVAVILLLPLVAR